MTERALLIARSPFLFVEGIWGGRMLVRGELAYHSEEQVRLVKPISVKFEELAMIWPKMDLVRNVRTVYHGLLSW